MHGKVRTKQQPDMRADGTVHIAGVKNAHFCNTDHVPVWYESVGNYSWGKTLVADSMSEPVTRRSVGSWQSST